MWQARGNRGLLGGGRDHAEEPGESRDQRQTHHAAARRLWVGLVSPVAPLDVYPSLDIEAVPVLRPMASVILGH